MLNNIKYEISNVTNVNVDLKSLLDCDENDANSIISKLAEKIKSLMEKNNGSENVRIDSNLNPEISDNSSGTLDNNKNYCKEDNMEERFTYDEDYEEIYKEYHKNGVGDFGEDEYEEDDFLSEKKDSENSGCPGYDISIDELELNVRSYNCLRRAGITTIGDLKSFGIENLKKIRNLGTKSSAEVIEKLEQFEASDDRIKNFKSFSQRLDELVGLDDVKLQVKRIAAFARMKKDMKEKSDMSVSMNMAFLGNPGTAKTTVARIIAGIFYEIGLIDSPNIVEVGRAELVARYIGQTAGNVKKIFKRAYGKVLFIDEAYSLVDEFDGSFGDEAINTIVSEMENNRDHTIVIFAGYPDKMKKFFDKNVGLKSRIQFSVEFKDYTSKEMGQIIDFEAFKKGFKIDAEARERIDDICQIAAGDSENGNGRFCRNFVENAVLNYAYRVYGSDKVENNDFCLISKDFSELKVAEKKRNPIGF